MSTMEQVTSPAIARLVAVDGRTYPLESARLEARAEGGIAFSTLRQTYANPYDEPLEVSYTMPLPADGAVLGYTVRVGDKTITADVQPRDKAGEAYREALLTGRTAGLMEQVRGDTFQQRLGNVPPHTQVEIAIDVLHPLAFLIPAKPPKPPHVPDDKPEWEYRFPTVAGVRYMGGRVPDARELSPDRNDEGAISTRMELALAIGGVAAGAVRSPSHAITQRADDGGAIVGFAAGERLDRDIVVHWDAAGAEVGVTLLDGAGLPGDDGRYALVTVVPPAAPATTFARDLTILIDASGSMGGEPLALAKRVAAVLLGSLREGDHFEVLAFASDVQRLTPALTPWTPRVHTAVEAALAALNAGGATEMAGALAQALDPARPRAQRQVVLVTDGYVGFEDEVVEKMAERQDTRLHVVGIGSAPNRTLTKMLATAGRGLELLVGDDGTARRAAQRLIAGTARPVLTSLHAGGSALISDTNGPSGDVFAGRPLVFAVELRPEGGDLELSADFAGTDERWIWRMGIPEAGAATRTPLPIGALYGRAHVAELELQIALGEGVHFLEHQIETAAMRHRIASRFTSLVAIAEEPSVDPRAPRRRERLAVEVPAGVSVEGTGLWVGSRRAAGYVEAPAFSGKMLGDVPTNLRLAQPSDHVDTAQGEAGLRVVVKPLRLAPDEIVVEVELGLDGELPAQKIVVVVEGPDGERRIDAEIVASRRAETFPGVFAKLTVRLAQFAEWPSLQRIALEWQTPRKALWRGGRRMRTAFFQLPPWTGAEAPGDR